MGKTLQEMTDEMNAAVADLRRTVAPGILRILKQLEEGIKNIKWEKPNE